MRNWIQAGLGVAVSVALIVTVSESLASTAPTGLAAKLLPASDLPSTMAPASFTNSMRDLGCLATVVRPAGLTASAVAEEYFVTHASQAPSIGEALATYPSGSSAFATVVATLRSRRCARESPGNPGQEISVTVRPLTGTSTSATFATSIGALGVPNIEGTVLVSVVGHDVIEVFDAVIPHLGNLTSQQFNDYAQLALARLR